MNRNPYKENTNETPTVCLVCYDAFRSDPQKRPRMLTCGHSFCHDCLQKWWTTQINVCPFCKQYMNYSSVDDVPINYQLQNAAEEVSKLKEQLSSLEAMQTNENEQKYEGHCNEHHLPNHFKCTDCLLFICGICQFSKHKSCHVVLYAEIVRSLISETNDSINKEIEDHVERLEVLNSEYKNKTEIREELKSKLITVEKELETFKTEITQNKNIIKRLKGQQESLKICRTVKDHEKVKNRFEILLAIKVENLKVLHNRLTVLDPSTFCKKNNVKLLQELLEGGPLKYGRIEVESDGRIRIHNFLESTSEIDANPIQFENLLCDLSVEQCLPLEAFFKIYRGNTFVGEIIVEVDSWSPRGINFILGASGILHNSYRGKHLFDYSDVVFPSNNFPALVEDIENGGIYSGERRRGSVYGYHTKNVDFLSHFGISKKDSNGRDETIFGRVTKGMEVVDQIQWNDSIQECGLII